MSYFTKLLKPLLLETRLGGMLLIPYRLWLALGYLAPQLKRSVKWAFSSRELTNVTYDITADNCEYLAHTISAVTRVPYSVAMSYLCEVQNEYEIVRHTLNCIERSTMRFCCDRSCRLGRRIGWYAFVRILKPRIVVETGVDKGHGAVVLCAALMRNEAEGFPGRYYGTDINPEAGFLLSEPYSRVGKILYGDSVETLRSFSEIDIFINDSDHSAEYERLEYDTIAPKLREGRGLILGDNCHSTDVLARFSAETKRQFVFFREQPKDHWYPGGGIGISFVSSARHGMAGTDDRDSQADSTPDDVICHALINQCLR